MSIAVAVLVLVVVVAIAMWWFSEEQRTRRALAATPRVTLAAFPDGAPARVVGTVQDGDRLFAPLTGRACVHYEVVVEQYRRDALGNSESWHQVVREVKSLPFTIDDGTGRARTDPAGAALAVEADASTSSGVLERPSPSAAEFLG